MVLVCLILVNNVGHVSAAQSDSARLQKIKLLSNRFRVDQAIETIVFIIERKPDSAPIILVRPDGSKLYANRKHDGIKWMDGSSGDMIEIKNPMIGPWQIIGDILPSSEIRLATSLQLKIDHIPDWLFVGEEIKLTASLIINDKLLSLGRVEDLIVLRAFLRSKNVKGNDNFGAGTFTVGQYIDDGIGFDARKGDGVFTGMLDLAKPFGPYSLMVRAGNKAFEREVSQDLMLRRIPMTVDLINAAIDGNYALRFITNEQVVDLVQSSLQIQISHPDKTVEELSISGLVAKHLYRLPSVSKPGRYKIDFTIYGKSVDGRDFQISLKSMRFKIAVPAIKEVKQQQVELDKARELKFKRQQRVKKHKEAMQKAQDEKALVITIVVVNLVIILLGGLLMWLFLRKKKSKAEKIKIKAEKERLKAEKKAVAAAKKETKAKK